MAGSVAEKRFARAQLSQALLLADPGSVTAKQREEALLEGADAVAVDSTTTEPPPHAVGVVLVDPKNARALVRMVYVAYERRDETLSGEAAQAVRAAIQLATRDTLPDSGQLSLVFAQPAALADVTIDGDSLSAAAWLSARAFVSGQRVRRGVVVTGGLVGTSEGPRLRSVGSLELKAQAAQHWGAEVFVAPEIPSQTPEGLRVVVAKGGPDIEQACLFPGTAREVDVAVAEALRATEGGWKGYKWRAIRERLSRTFAHVPNYRVDSRVDVLVRWAAAERHLGDPERSLELIRSARAITRTAEGRESVPDATLSMLERQAAMTSLRLFEFQKAKRAAARATSIAKRARLRTEIIKSLGTRGLCEVALDEHEEAVLSFEEGLYLTLKHTPFDAARSRAYLIEALGFLGDGVRAQTEFELALAEAKLDSSGAKEAWVRTSYGRCLVTLGNFARALEVVDVESVHQAINESPLPGLLAQRWLGIALVETGQTKRGLNVLTSAGFSFTSALEPWLETLWCLNLLHASRLELRLGLPLSVPNARAALSRLPRYGRAHVLHARLRESALLELEAWKDRPASGDASSFSDTVGGLIVSISAVS